LIAIGEQVEITQTETPIDTSRTQPPNQYQQHNQQQHGPGLSPYGYTPTHHPVIIRFELPNALFERILPAIHHTFLRWQDPTWKQYIWHMRKQERLPRDLQHEVPNSTQLRIGAWSMGGAQLTIVSCFLAGIRCFWPL